MSRTRKRKLALSDFSRCHPKQKGTKKCLPSSTYSEIASKLKTNDVFQAVGCKADEDHCLLDKAPLTDDVKKRLRKD